MVRVDGANAVLMTILKAGSVSTLDVINGVKALLPKLRETLPASLKLDAVGDQSTFVNAAVNSVIFEGAIAAALTGLMILVFLGSWRSTLIITISIPLAILASIAALSAIGETINVMTLGGLALAVGILVDDATVTIENINWHLEQGKDIEVAIMDGARQIVIPATVSLLCICIVFVPMFGLGGVAGYLFRPMAEAVVFALIGLLCAFAYAGEHAGALSARQSGGARTTARPAPTRNPFVAVPARLRAPVRARRAGSTGACWRPRLAGAGGSSSASCWRSPCSFALAPFLGQNFFPPVESTQLKLHVRAPTGTRIEETARLCDRVEAVDPPDRSRRGARVRWSTTSGCRSAASIPPTAIRARSDRRTPTSSITLKPGYASEVGRLRQEAARDPAELVPGHDFAFLPADIVSQILNFGLPSPIDVQVFGANFDANHAYADKLLKQIARVPGVADARIQQASNNPTLDVDVDRMRAAQVGLNEGDVAKSLQETLSGSFKVAPTFWINPKNGVAYPIVAQTPQYWLEFAVVARERPRLAARRLADPRRPGDDQARASARRSFRITRCSRSSTFTRPTTSATSARSRPTSRKSSTRPRRTRRAGSTVVLRGQTADDDLRLPAAVRRPCAGRSC